MIELLLLLYIVVYCPLIIYVYSSLLKKYEDPKYHRSDIPEKFQPFRRRDYKNWNKLEIYFGAIFLLPLRLIFVLGSLFAFAFVFFVTTKDFKLENPWPANRYKFLRQPLQFLARAYLFFSGFYQIKQRVVKYSDYDQAYVQTQINVLSQPSIIVSNHVSWYDTITYVFKYLPSFVSKDTVKDYPVFGWITTNLKSIFVERENANNRKQVMLDILNRVNLINQGHLFPPVLIFPEGTTSNGNYILSFKKGAFEPLQPIKICCLKYSPRRFSVAMDCIGIYATTLLSLVQWKNELEIIEFEGLYDPTYLKLEQYPEEKRWEIYADKVKDIMSKCLGLEKSNSGFREEHDYEVEILGEKKKKQTQNNMKQQNQEDDKQKVE
ncbi:unnamed protein product [Paramecium pentaurelia]|uniref:Phospholipid/glycerol acyltransferase domain-containing protein n=1 Tax=Paramecium pentaurelia TaxID=43138 RepID=A0A8S1VDA8_9CILI|nr:unnamed protein product [Paramecium pentaurelia]